MMLYYDGRPVLSLDAFMLLSDGRLVQPGLLNTLITFNNFSR